MTITSFSFLLLVGLGLVVYYIIPAKFQWIELLMVSLLFYYYAGVPYTIIYLIISTIIAYASTMIMARFKNRSQNKACYYITILAIAINVFIWFVIKGKGLWYPVSNMLLKHINASQIEYINNIEIVAALGMGYYTLQVCGYIIDCYWEIIEPQKNPIKLFLFVTFFPQLVTGPISRYDQLRTLYDEHKISYKNVTFGAQRVLWGFVKKLVLAERLGIIVGTIVSSPEKYMGIYSIIVILLYPLQIYADFSGCMDIVIGVAEMYDIKLAENFNNPFFSKSSQEFWQRWHITLGSWAKDYVLYPFLKVRSIVKFGKWAKKRYGQRIGKFIINAIGMFVLWMIMGLWHGGWKHIVGVSIWYWSILMLGNLCSKLFTQITTFMHMKTDTFSWHLFQAIRTYMIFAVGATIFNVGVIPGVNLLLDVWKVITVKDYANPWILFDGSILKLGVTYGDINISIIVIILLIIVAYLREKYGYARIWVQRQGLIFRWFIWISLFVLVLIYGKYGPDFNATDFIYQGF